MNEEGNENVDKSKLIINSIYTNTYIKLTNNSIRKDFDFFMSNHLTQLVNWKSNILKDNDNINKTEKRSSLLS